MATKNLLALLFAFTFPIAQAADGDGVRQFAGLNFGVGLSLTVDTGDHDRIDEAQIIDGLVRVDKESNARARIMLESHYFFTPGKAGGNFLRVNNGNWGVGPFVALQPGTDEIIEAIAAGIMIGFKRNGSTSGGSWNFGLGVVVDPNVQILGDGFIENSPPPGTETIVRFKEASQVGVLLITSFSF